MPSDSASLQAAGAVLIVDDSGYARSRLKRFLRERGYAEVVEAASGEQAMSRFTERRPRVVLMDQVMRGRAGIDTARLMVARDPEVDVILLTVVTDRLTHEAALSAGVKRIVQKADYGALSAALRELGHE